MSKKWKWAYMDTNRVIIYRTKQSYMCSNDNEVKIKSITRNWLIGDWIYYELFIYKDVSDEVLSKICDEDKITFKPWFSRHKVTKLKNHWARHKQPVPIKVDLRSFKVIYVDA